MKNSKIILFLAAFVVGITGCEVESEKHEHTFSKEWTSDAIAHWHAATCEHKTETSGIAAHTFGEWKVTKEATETHEGERQRACSVCKYVEKETVAKLEHTHKFNPWIVTKEATESEEGEKERTCSVCKYVEKDIIPKLEHTHIFSEKWASDGENHWHAATCEHKTEISDKAAHIFGEWTTITNPTETSNGQKERTCSVCKYVESFIIPSLEHTHDFSEDWTNDETSHWHICNKGCSEVEGKTVHQWDDGTIWNEFCTKEGDKVYKCLTCDRERWEFVPPRGHAWTEIWHYDETNHWHNCCRCDEVNDKAAHQWIISEILKEETCTEAGNKKYKCSVCGMIKQEYPSALGHIWKKYEPYDAYGYTAFGHKAKCERCDKLIEESHKWNVIKLEPICKDGKNTYTCSKCSVTKVEIIPAVHVYGKWTVTPATEDTEGKTERVCSMCKYHDIETIPKILDALVKVPSATFATNTEWKPKSEVLAGRRISIRSLYVSDHEVTKGEYRKIIGNLPKIPYDFDFELDENNKVLTGEETLENPVCSISWYHAIIYCNKLSKKEGLVPCYTIGDSTDPDEWGEVPTKANDEKWDDVKCNFDANGYRLPTEVEWEYLARGGNPKNGYDYSGGNLYDVCWYEHYKNANTVTRKVRTKKPNELKLYDMSGNVYELCWDWEGSVSKVTPLEGNYSPVESDNGSKRRVMRGGSIFSYRIGFYNIFEVSNRKYNAPGSRSYEFGFRVVRTAQ